MDKIRNGNFNSSEIVALVNSPKTAKTFVEECNMERRLGRSLSCESNARPLSWGSFVEKRAFDLLDTSYILSSQETVVHPKYNYWVGTKDALKNDEGKTVVDIKCPITLKSFCQFVDCKNIDEIRNAHRDGDKYYWQLVSNACINDCKFAELIIYVPYQNELSIIRDMASNHDGDQNKIAWINWSADEDLPYLIYGGHYKNINVFRFEVPEADKFFLESKVVEYGQQLISI